MAERPRFLDDLAGMAGGALSALTGMREEVEAMVRARIDEAMRRLDVVRREELDAVAEMAANARAGQEAAEAKLAEIMARLTALEQQPPVPTGLSSPAGVPGGTLPGGTLPGGSFEGGGGLG